MPLKMPVCKCLPGEVAPPNIYQDVTKGKKFFNMDMKSEFAGSQIVDKIVAGEFTAQEAIKDCICYARRHGNKKETHLESWLCMHLALGLCHKYDIKDKPYIRDIMKEILPYSRGIDAGLFLRDVSALGETGQFLDKTQKDLLEKAMFFLRIACGFVVDLSTDNFGRKVYGSLKPNIPDKVPYIDLPIGNPAYGMGTAAASVASPLLTACEKLEPWAVLTLLRYGATAHGEAMNYILASLSHAKEVQDQKKTTIAESPVVVTKTILNYLLRGVNHLKLVFDDQKVGETLHDKDVYYVSKNITNFVDEQYYCVPNKLKQLCRTRIRELILDNGSMPQGFYELPKPLITTHKRYLDLLA